MLVKLLLSLSLIATLSVAQTPSFKEGSIKAHTEILGDSAIEPKSTKLQSRLSLRDTSIESLRGELILPLSTLKSDNEKRDSHMYETLHTKESPNTSFKILSATPMQDGYQLIGILTLNQKPKEVKTLAKIDATKETVKLVGDFSFNLSDFSLEPPTLLFLSVRDQIDIHYDVTLAIHE